MVTNEIEKIFPVAFSEEEGSVVPGNRLSSCFELNGLKYLVTFVKSDEMLFMAVDPVNAYYSIPLVEISVRCDAVEFESIVNTGTGVHFLYKGVRQALYLTRTDDSLNVSLTSE